MAGRLSFLRAALLFRHCSSSLLRSLPISPIPKNLSSCAPPYPFLSQLFHHVHSATALENDSYSSHEGAPSGSTVFEKSEESEAVEPKNAGNAARSSKKLRSKMKRKGSVSEEAVRLKEEGDGRESSSSGKDSDGKSEEFKGVMRKPRSLKKEGKLPRQNPILKQPLMTEKRDGISVIRRAGGLSSLFRKPSLGDFGSYKPVVLHKGKTSSNLIREKAIPSKDSSSSEVELTPEAVAFLERLQEDGYLNNVDLLQDGKVVPHRLHLFHVQNLLKSAVEKFGIEHQEIAKWLSGSNLKRVAIFGCPSVESKSVFSAKSMRSFFGIQEDVVCRACKLKSSCKFVNKNPMKSDKLILLDALRVLTTYSFSQAPQQLVISSEMKESIAKMLKEIVSLSK